MFNLNRLFMLAVVTILVNVILIASVFNSTYTNNKILYQEEPINENVDPNLANYMQNVHYFPKTKMSTIKTILSTNNKSSLNLKKFSLFDKENFFLIEPSILEQTLNRLDSSEMETLKVRFRLPEFDKNYLNNSNKLTVGTFSDNVDVKLKILIQKFNLVEFARSSDYVPFDRSQLKQLTHVFLHSAKQNLKFHIVIFYPVKHFLWIGKISDTQLLQIERFYYPQFGYHEAIYDSFELKKIDSWMFPNDIGHFLTQIPTSRYLHCPEERNQWITANKLSSTKKDIEAAKDAIVSMKSLMKQLQMEFWIVCGTLLGWLRQCHITPQGGDTDFATWSSYVQNGPITELLKSTVESHGLRLHFRFGEAARNLEYSFYTKPSTFFGQSEKVDLFLMYSNQTHFMMSLHHQDENEFAYLFYPQYSLCSVELLGYKLLAPCDPKPVVLTEYGPSWTQKVQHWDYLYSSLNRGPFVPFKANVTQLDTYFYFLKYFSF